MFTPGSPVASLADLIKFWEFLPDVVQLRPVSLLQAQDLGRIILKDFKNERLPTVPVGEFILGLPAVGVLLFDIECHHPDFENR